MQNNFDEYSDKLMEYITHGDNDDKIVDYLIMLGKKNVFIQTVIDFIAKAKMRKNLTSIAMLTKHINAAYNPGLRAQILDDFTRERLVIENKVNELKSKLGIYSMEQQLKLYSEAETMLKQDFTTATTHSLMKVFDFRTMEERSRTTH